MWHSLWIAILSLTLLGTVPAMGRDKTGLEYQNRGNRFEGVKTLPVSGYDIELISVLADYRDPSEGMPEELHLKFYLPEQENIHITVRELDYQHYYWVDRILPIEPWTVGFDNGFSWSTEFVLKQLGPGIDPYKLGVVARFNRPEPGAVERVAPVILYHSVVPSSVSGYFFTLKPSSDARLRCTITPVGKIDPIWQRTIRRQAGGRPLTIHWEASVADRGTYVLRATGYFLDTNRPVEQIVYFFHESKVE